MVYLRMDALLIRADLECLDPQTMTQFSCKIVEKYNNVVSLQQHKEYFESMTKHNYPNCVVTHVTLRVSQNDEFGKLIIDTANKSCNTPLWEVVYPEHKQHHMIHSGSPLLANRV